MRDDIFREINGEKCDQCDMFGDDFLNFENECDCEYDYIENELDKIVKEYIVYFPIPYLNAKEERELYHLDFCHDFKQCGFTTTINTNYTNFIIR